MWHERLLFLVSLVCVSYSVHAQTLSQGPFVGAMTHNSCRAYVRTSAPGPVDFQVATDSNAFASGLTFTGSTLANDDNGSVVAFTGLQPNTKYFYRVRVNGQPQGRIQWFTTFPDPGQVVDFTFAFGSCQTLGAIPYQEPIFRKVLEANPLFFIQSGDWGYPDTTDNIPGNNNFFAANWTKVLESYRAKYAGTDMIALMQQVPIDYMYDDHDYVNDNASSASASYYTASPFQEVALPAGARRNAIDAYTRFFPHYDLVDTAKGIYHSFRCGQVEFFVIDNRSSKSPNLNSLAPLTNSTLTFNPPAGHSILGPDQLQWLVNGLKNSTAKWKFIVGGVPFNQGYSRLIDALSGNSTFQNLIPIPGIPNPKSILAEYVEKWAGFPNDANAILDLVQNQGVKNVIFLSSDSHTSAMDDGANAGIPEVMSGNLAQTNFREAQLFQTAGTFLQVDLNIWNSGGQGLGNNNFENAFGKIQVYGNDSVVCNLIAESGTLIAKMTICADGLPCPTPASISSTSGPGRAIQLYPNPSTESITVEIDPAAGF